MPGLFKHPNPYQRLILPEGVNGVYHVVSRVVDKDMKLGEVERDYFIGLMHDYAAFCGVKLLSWVVMSNHFHILVEVPPVDKENMSPEEVFERLSYIWGEGYMVKARELFRECETEKEVRAFCDKVTYRMGDLREYMKSIKQQFTLWFNRRHEREGTLWEGAYRSVIVEGDVPLEVVKRIEGEGDRGESWESKTREVAMDYDGGGDGAGYEVMSDAARIVAAYIDLNPVRAGMVKDPADYRWSSYGAAVEGDSAARAGLARLWSRGEESAMAAHRVLVFDAGSEEHVPEDGEKSKRVGIPREKVEEVVRQGGKLPMKVFLRVKVRYLTAGAIIGSREFIRKVYEGRKAVLGENRSRISTPMRHGEWGGLHVFRNLGKKIIG